MSTTPISLDLNNIQGDILSGLPKKTQYYIFFKIQDAAKFRSDLAHFIPLIKTVAQVLKDRDDIDDHKRRGQPGLIPLVGVNISISHFGFVKLGIDDSTLAPNGTEDVFVKGQKQDAITNLGDPKRADGNPDWEDAFLNEIDGLIIISGESHATIEKKKHEIEHIFGVHTHHASIQEVKSIRGDVRPGDQSGHEHFGFLDGISNPTVNGFDTNVNPGPKSVDPGKVLVGQTGDPTPTREDWAKDGSFLVFRYLFQLVPEFDKFLEEHPLKKDGNGKDLTPEKGSELLGARMVGRWKSGAPIDVSPFQDDPELADDPKRTNDFKFEGERTSQLKCPFAAHVRKTNPRDDLEPDFSIDDRRILRRGVQFGPEVTRAEHNSGKTIHDRGLLFTCYQSHIENGFQFLQQSWANTANFPPFTGIGNATGLDPLIGQGDRAMSGLDPLSPQNVLPIDTFIIPRGGEYFFSPSLKALKENIATGVQFTVQA
ncbi:peroxidase TAP [Crepidotus variabilis]|uniref:Peroxidase TAP n=1 Tax=Crepidotus variabilis TaxID=179855 RepID=A0A9P6E8B7_9AGAR|nr:peroxidase TAP [Crepidotus variabilis]